MTHRSQRECPVCGGHEGTTLHRQRFVLPEDHPLADGYEVAGCARCGMVFADTAATQEDYDLFYARFSKYEDSATATGGGGSAWDRQRLADTAAWIAAHLPDQAARIADIGCGNGGLLLQLRALGFPRLCGVDPSPGCVRNMKAQGLEAFVGTVHRLPIESGRFGCAILSHVLEHVRDVRPAVNACAERLEPGGVLYLEVPDAARYAHHLAAPFQDFNTEHINHFSLQALRNLVFRCGLDPCAEGHKLLQGSTAVPYPCVFLLCRRTARPAGIEAKDPSLESAVREYVERSQTLLGRISRRIEVAMRRDSEWIVWGTGQLLFKLLAETSLGGARIAAFVDGNPIHHGKRLLGRPILSPGEAAHLPHPILISTLLHEQAIREAIRLLGMPNEVLALSDGPDAERPIRS